MSNLTVPESFELTREQAKIVLICLDSPTYSAAPDRALAADLRRWIRSQQEKP